MARRIKGRKGPITVPARISISRTHSNKRDDYVSISLEDGSSRCLIVEIEISLLMFADALFSRGDCTCKATVYRDSPVGAVLETKTVVIPTSDRFPYGKPTAKEIAKALSPYEVDGWMARESDLTNGHNSAVGGMRVNFHRFVDTTTKEPVDVLGKREASGA